MPVTLLNISLTETHTGLPSLWVYAFLTSYITPWPLSHYSSLSLLTESEPCDDNRAAEWRVRNVHMVYCLYCKCAAAVKIACLYRTPMGLEKRKWKETLLFEDKLQVNNRHTAVTAVSWRWNCDLWTSQTDKGWSSCHRDRYKEWSL